jgi:hypothetical protein
MLSYKFLLILNLIIINLCQKSDNNPSYINDNDFTIKNAIYIIRNRNDDFDIQFHDESECFDSKEKFITNFELIKDKNNGEKEIFYFIKENLRNRYISSQGNKFITISNKDDLEENKSKDNALWKIIPKINKDNKLIYYIQNKKEQNYWKYDNTNKKNENLDLSQISNEKNLNENNEFIFIELYQNFSQENSELLGKEPIDVLIKYIDFSDKNIAASGLRNISNDFKNEELRFSVRSILQNIPWIRKIFILMPNEKVRYFLPTEKIENKIVYIKDKTLLGFDCENSCSFQYNLYKMKNFGLSENFILMDDNHFISSPINKNEFFYEENGEIFPALISSNYNDMSKMKLEEILKLKLYQSNRDNPYSPEGFNITQIRALLFLYEIFGDDDKRFGKKLIEPAFTHNAIPVKMSDIKEIHKYIFNDYEYGKQILYEKERSIHDLQFQTLYMAYVKNKYNRKVSKIPSEFFDITQAFKILRSDKKLFSIITPYNNYDPIIFQSEKYVLKRFFPIKTDYEFDEEEEKRQKEFKILVDTILNLSINEINEKIEMNYEKYNNLLPQNISFQNQEISNDYGNNYKIILKEQMQYMKDQCFYQEIINCILFIFWILLILYRYISTKTFYIKK